jgi:hypothetical protein
MKVGTSLYTRFHKFLGHRRRVAPLQKYLYARLYGIFDNRVGGVTYETKIMIFADPSLKFIFFLSQA